MKNKIEALQEQIEQLTKFTQTAIAGTTMDERQLDLQLETLEYVLDGLYDKSRMLADLHDEVQEWAKREIEQTEDILADTVYGLEKNMNRLLDSGSVLITLPRNSARDCRLKDGTVLPKCVIGKDSIHPKYTVAATTPVESIHIERSESPERSTMELATEQAGRVTYKTSKPKDISETLMLRLPQVFNANYLDCQTVNAEIVAMSAVDSNGEVINIENKNGFFLLQAVSELRIKLQAKGYILEEKEAVKEPSGDLLLGTGESVDENMTREELEKLLNETYSEAVAEEKLRSYDSWQASMTSIKARNAFLAELGAAAIELSEAGTASKEVATEKLYTYLFGTDSLSLQRVVVPSACGVTYAAIKLGVCDYIKVLAEYEGNGLELIINDNGKETSVTQGERYVPVSDSIDLKIILRQAGGDVPTIVNKIAIQKFGGVPSWL